MAIYISSKGERTDITPGRPPYFSDRELELFVEGRPAFLVLDDGTTLVYNDVYYEIGVEKNEAATQLALRVLPENTWLAGPVVHLPAPIIEPLRRDIPGVAEQTANTLYLYMIRFEMRDRAGRYTHDEIFLTHVRDEAELRVKIAELATTKAKGRRFLGAEQRVHGMTILHDHVPATVTRGGVPSHATQK